MMVILYTRVAIVGRETVGGGLVPRLMGIHQSESETIRVNNVFTCLRDTTRISAHPPHSVNLPPEFQGSTKGGSIWVSHVYQVVMYKECSVKW